MISENRKECLTETGKPVKFQQRRISVLVSSAVISTASNPIKSKD
ncbi:hypothetical protein LEP1GSC036_4710 [Leptospira weilii str. 2006001853]|uniref:Uncharacterized protein n=1 Tax=Leptospira weilii str. 2006001853 TaxID=1001589 RepID=A0A828Z662_9LEPT|nr:hypothetical protein LEP1GSC036_4710 [Leptospira weilii str. 2006001853]